MIKLQSISGKSQCPLTCDSDFDCRWGQVCEYGICANNEEIHWKCNGVFNDPHESCDRYTGRYLPNNETQGITLLKNSQSKISLTYMGLKKVIWDLNSMYHVKDKVKYLGCFE